MRTAIAIATILALTALAGCRTTSRQGGIASMNEEFTMTAPSSNTVKQGGEATITISLNRGAHFKRDVQLDLKTEGIGVTPTSVLVKASDRPDVHFQIAVARDAALGEYRVTVKGTPASGEPAGEPTSMDFTVKVIAQ